MSDIFVSYASADRERAKLLADVLVERGFTVWWDRAIPPGRQFDEVIEEALDAARCVVVLWSQTSTASTWVKTEAAEAMRRKVLIPAIIEKDVRIPLEFRRLQAADLSAWQGDRSDPQLLHFFQSIESEVKRVGETSAAAPVIPSVDTPHAPSPERPAPPVKPRPAPPIAPAPRVESKPKARLSPALLGGVAAIVIAIVGAGLYYERASSIERAEKVALAKAAEEQARSEKERAEREAAARAAAGRADTGQRQPKQPAPNRAPQPVPQAGVLNLQWRDHALGFNGSLTWNPGSAVLRVAVVDLQTGTPIGNFAVPALIAQQGPMEYVVSGQFGIGGDSTTPGPHTHVSRLLLRAQQDGTLRFMQNCPQPGECY